MYTLKILGNEDFDALPYKHAKRSLGLADAKTGVAFVRDTGYNDITKATISHELDELVANVSPHEEDGIRYKSLASLGAGAGAGALTNVLGSMLPGKWGEFATNIAPLASAGAGYAANRKGQPIRGALQGFTGGGLGSSLLSGASDVIGGLTKPGGTFGQAFKSFLPGAERAATSYIGAIPGMKGFETDQPKGKLAQWLMGSSPTATQTLAKKGTSGLDIPGFEAPRMQLPGTEPTVRPTTTTTGGGGDVLQKKGLLDKLFGEATAAFGRSIPGIATAAIGDMFAPDVDVPDIAGVGKDLREQLASGRLGDVEARGLGMEEMRRILGEPLGTVPETAFALGDIQIEEAKQDALAQYINQFKSIRPGADFRNDPEFLRGWTELENKYDRVRTAQRDQMQFEYNRQQLTDKYNTMVQALNMDQYQMNQAIQLAQLEIDQLMLEYGLSVQEATEFKQLFGDLGQLMVQSAQPSMSLDIKGILDAFKTGGQK